MVRVNIHRVHVQYACAVLLIASSIALAFLNESRLGNIANGVLLYIAQAFLLAGSILGYNLISTNSTTMLPRGLRNHNPLTSRLETTGKER